MLFTFCYCAEPLIFKGMVGCNSRAKCKECEGDCQSDKDCKRGLRCFSRGDNDADGAAGLGMGKVPGCSLGGPGDQKRAKFCIVPGIWLCCWADTINIYCVQVSHAASLILFDQSSKSDQLTKHNQTDTCRWLTLAERCCLLASLFFADAK